MISTQWNPTPYLVQPSSDALCPEGARSCQEGKFPSIRLSDTAETKLRSFCKKLSLLLGQVETESLCNTAYGSFAHQVSEI